jgi:hypothetical protein
MSPHKQKPTDDDVEAAVLAELDDPDAWEEPVYAPPSRSPRPAWATAGRHFEAAARLHIASVLNRLGIDANLTLPSSGDTGVDIAVVQPSGKVITLAVKTLLNAKTWHAGRFHAREDHYIAFVIFAADIATDPSAAPEVLVFPSILLNERLADTRTISDVPKLARELGLRDPWQQLVAAAA